VEAPLSRSISATGDGKLFALSAEDIMISSPPNVAGMIMAQFVVRHLEDSVKARLQRRAARHGRSMEDEVRHILRDAVKEGNSDIAKLGSRIAARFAKVGLAAELPELRGQAAQSVKFGK
jgi:antitoxin FitA